MNNKMITVESLFQLIFNFKDYNDIGNFSGLIMGDQIVGPDFAVDVTNGSLWMYGVTFRVAINLFLVYILWL